MLHVGVTESDRPHPRTAVSPGKVEPSLGLDQHGQAHEQAERVEPEALTQFLGIERTRSEYTKNANFDGTEERFRSSKSNTKLNDACGAQIHFHVYLRVLRGCELSGIASSRFIPNQPPVTWIEQRPCQILAHRYMPSIPATKQPVL